MNTLTTTLEAAQKQASMRPLVKITLTQGSDTVELRETRLHKIPAHHEEPYRHNTEVVFKNSDGYFTDLDFKGYKCVISYGVLTEEGEEFDDRAPLWVMAQQSESAQGVLICTLVMVGIPNLMVDDRASESYIPDEDDTKTVKTILSSILDSSMTCFSHCPAYTVVYDSEDSLIDSYKPKDSFRIYKNGSRMAAIRRLLDWTKCVIRYGSDGKVHILNPTVSGATYDYEYSLEDKAHTFFAKAYRKTLVLPNKVVVESRKDDDPQYSGSATDATSFALLPKTEYRQTRLQSNSEADDIAEAILSKYQLNAEMGAATAPMNLGAEVFDYVKVTDARGGDSRIGNIGSLTRSYSPGKYQIRFSFGDWLTVKKLLNDIETNSDAGAYFERLSVDTLYAKHILLSDIEDDANYRRTKATSITAEGIVILDQVVEGTYGLIKKASLTAEGLVVLDQCTGDIDDIGDGSIYQRVKSAALNASGLVLLDQLIAGTYGLLLATDISAGHIKLTTSTVATGKWYDTSGIEIDASAGIKLWGSNNLRFYSSSNYQEGNINAVSGDFSVEAYHYNTNLSLRANDGEILLSCGDSIILRPNSTIADEIVVSQDILYPYASNDKYLGAAGSYWKGVFAGVYYGKNTTIQSFQNHDDIKMLRGIRDNGGHLVPATFPQELIETEEEMEQALVAGNAEIERLKHDYNLPLSKITPRINIIERNMAESLASPGINMMNWQSLLMGAILQLAERVKELENN